MIGVKKAATYIFWRYKNEKGRDITEMMLHKLLYFSQREAIVMTDEPMFPEQFEAWKYGPVMVCIREMYKSKSFINPEIFKDELKIFIPVFDSVFEKYADKDPWALSDLTHSEISWRNARKSCTYDVICTELLKLEDIRQDAQNIALRRFYIDKILPRLHAN